MIKSKSPFFPVIDRLNHLSIAHQLLGKSRKPDRRRTIQLSSPIHLRLGSSSRSSLPGALPYLVPCIKKKDKCLLDTFKRVIRLIRLICRVFLNIRRYSINKADSKVMTKFQSSYTTGKNNSKHTAVYFDKDLYSVDNNHTFPYWARNICRKHPFDRSDEELKKLRKYLRGIQTFSQFDDQTEICKNIIYNRYDKLRIILSQGDAPEHFYILLSGSVNVTISKIDSNTGVEVESCVDILKEHDAFGGTALINSTFRTATVTSATIVEVLLIDKETFLDCCMDTMMKGIEKSKQFLESNSAFRGWPPQRLKLMSYDVKTKYYRCGKIIEKDLKHSNHIYFVMEGEVDVVYSDEDKQKGIGLYSEKLQRTVGILGGNRITAPQPCNLLYMIKDREEKDTISYCLISHNATVLYLPKSRFQELAPKDFLQAQKSNHSSFRHLTDKDYQFESQKAISWIEYRTDVAKRKRKRLKK